MKQQKILSLDPEVIQELKKVSNGSKLVNDMLIEYFYSGGGQEKAEIENNIMLLERKNQDNDRAIEKLKQRVIDLDAREKAIKAKFANIPLAILEDFKNFPKMSQDSLLSRYNEEYFGTVEWEELLEAYKEYFKK